MLSEPWRKMVRGQPAPFSLGMGFIIYSAEEYLGLST